MLRLSTYVVGYSAKKGPFPDEEEKCVFFLWARKTKFSEAHRKKLSLFSTSTVKLALFWLKTQQLRWTTPLAHQELPCSCDKLDFWQPWLFHGRNKSGNIFPRIYWCRKNTIFDTPILKIPVSKSESWITYSSFWNSGLNSMNWCDFLLISSGSLECVKQSLIRKYYCRKSRQKLLQIDCELEAHSAKNTTKQKNTKFPFLW